MKMLAASFNFILSFSAEGRTTSPWATTQAPFDMFNKQIKMLGLMKTNS